MFKAFNEELVVKTKKNFEIIDLTSDAERFVKKSNVKNGTITITTQHTTTSVRVNENEKLLLKDIEKHLSEIVPIKDYNHDNIKARECPPNEPKNAHSHLKALLMGASETLPIINGKIKLGQWQHILFFELDGPRERRVTFSFIGES